VALSQMSKKYDHRKEGLPGDTNAFLFLSLYLSFPCRTKLGNSQTQSILSAGLQPPLPLIEEDTLGKGVIMTHFPWATVIT